MDTQNTDNDLMRQMREGKVSAFQLLYKRHQGAIYRYALMRCGRTALAADVVQDVFMGLLNKSFTYNASLGSLQNFLFGVTRNLLLKQEYAESRHQPLPAYGEEEDEVLQSEACDLSETIFSRQLTNQVQQAIAMLRPHYRDVVILYELQELSYAEIAVICSIDIGTVRSRLSRARAAMLDYCKKLDWNPGSEATRIKTGTEV